MFHLHRHDRHDRRHARHEHGPWERHGRGGRRGGRVLDHGDLRLLILQLLQEKPRHGYEIIKAIEEKLGGAYSPSPGAIYPMLQMLEEADLVVSRADGNKRLYSITEQGRAYLQENAEDLARINAQIDEVSAEGSEISLGDEVRDIAKAVFMRLRRGQFTPEQARSTGSSAVTSPLAGWRTTISPVRARS